ncbi:sensor histidine kinase [Hirschia litorea]|uniref:histidine kinase n=1 Tax=Hirschia litorea TaxID=1199156 RepID=A0ABW2IHG2_9PROT
MSSAEDDLTKLRQELADLKAEYQEYAYLVSHDLSAPFRQIEGFARIIAKHNDANFDEKTLRYLNFVIDGADNGKALLASLLKFSRLNTETQPYSEVECNLLIDEIRSEFSALIIDTKAIFEVGELPIVWADKAHIKIVFAELIRNALIYHKQSMPPLVSIQAEELPHFWQLHFVDNGIGIPAKLYQHVFKILRRGVTNEEFPGSGMGLALADKVIKAHGGEISLKSEVGNGTKISFTIPKPSFEPSIKTTF